MEFGHSKNGCENMFAFNVAGSYLFFGCHNKDKDFYFSSEWHLLESKSLLKLFTAFSRDQVLKHWTSFFC